MPDPEFPEIPEPNPDEPEPDPAELFAVARLLEEAERPIITKPAREMPDLYGDVDSRVPDDDVQALEVGRRVLKKKEALAKKLTYLPDTHRLLPQSPDAERGVLSSFLLSPREVGGMCAEKRVTADYFFIPAHSEIFQILMDLWDANKQIDFITLTQHLRDKGKLDQCGGAAFMTELFTFLPTAANAAYYLEILLEKYVLREIIKICTEYASRSYDEQDDVPALLDGVEKGIFAISNFGTTAAIKGAKQGVVEAIDHIEQLYERRGAIGGLATGFVDFDKMTDGLHGAEMIVIAARPSQGKTALAMNMAEHMAIEGKHAILVFSLEMSYQQLMQRLLCSRARVDITRVRDGFLSERDFPALQTAASKIAESRLFIDDSSSLSIQEIRAKARRIKMQYDVQAIFVDYLQLITGSTKRSKDNREQEVAEISKGLKAMAKELGIPVVVVAMLGRQFETRGANARPRLSDLRESGQIEADADLVAFMVRPETNSDLNDEERHALEGQAECIIAKQRHGPVGTVYLTFLKEFTRFETRARERDPDDTEHQETRLL